MAQMVIQDFESCVAALTFIDELKAKNNCQGYLSNTPIPINVLDAKTEKQKQEFDYKWHVRYDADLVKTDQSEKNSSSKKHK